MRILCATVLVGAFTVWPHAVTGQEPTDEAVAHEIVKRALPAIVSGANEWMADNDCVSCHTVTHAAWALNLAAIHLSSTENTGVTDEQRKQINQWSTDWTKVANPKVRAEAKQKTTLQNDADTVAQALLGVAMVQNSFEEDWAKTYHNSIIEGQQQAGFWKPGGQLPLQKRPLRETQEVTTMWALVALNSSKLSVPEEGTIKDKATQWLASKDRITAGKSTEWWALKSLLTDGNLDASLQDAAITKLLSFQNDNGGWGWLVNEDSDALGTGIALFALAQHSSPIVAEARIRAIKFLRTTQLADGSWNVKGTKKSGRNEVVDTASYWGTCWAVIGLLQ